MQQNTIAVLISIFILFVSGADAAGPGTSAATFLKLGFGARALALGETFVALADDPSALHYNPAGLAFPQSGAMHAAQRGGPSSVPARYELLVSHALHIQDMRLSQFALMKRPFGVSMTYLSIGGLERRTSETAEPEGTFGASDFAFGISYGRMLSNTGVGATIKIISQTIDNKTANAFSMDLGVMQPFTIRGLPFTLGGAVSNIGTKVKFRDEGYPLPLIFRAGLGTSFSKTFPANIGVQVDFPRDSSPVGRIGMEYLGFGPFALRAGYMTASSSQREAVLGKALGSSSSGLSDFFGVFMGMGFRFKKTSLDYSLLPYGELGSAHRFSVGMKF